MPQNHPPDMLLAMRNAGTWFQKLVSHPRNDLAALQRAAEQQDSALCGINTADMPSRQLVKTSNAAADLTLRCLSLGHMWSQDHRLGCCWMQSTPLRY